MSKPSRHVPHIYKTSWPGHIPSFIEIGLMELKGHSGGRIQFLEQREATKRKTKDLKHE
jgi:hypothetical protein